MGMSLEQTPSGIIIPRLKIVTVDDEFMLSKLMEMNLKKAGHSVTPFTNPLDVLMYLKSNIMDLLITDGMMPQMRGEALAGEVSQYYPTMGRLLVSGTVDQHTKNPWLFDAVLKKPYRSQQLRDAVDTAYLNSQSRRKP